MTFGGINDCDKQSQRMELVTQSLSEALKELDELGLGFEAIKVAEALDILARQSRFDLRKIDS